MLAIEMDRTEGSRLRSYALSAVGETEARCPETSRAALESGIGISETEPTLALTLMALPAKGGEAAGASD
jgi:hypothetical protein